MAKLTGIDGRRFWWRPIAVALLVAGLAACDCNGEEPDEVDEYPEVPQRDRSAEISKPDFAGPAPDDFDPDEKSRIVDPDEWGVSLRAAGMPGAVPTEVVAVIDRSVVRRGQPEIGPGTAIRVRDESGQSIDVDRPTISDRDSVFRAPIEEGLTPGQSYTISFESVEFQFGDDDEEDIEFVEFEDPPQSTFQAPPLEIVDVSPARPVGQFGHVELRFSAGVDVDDVEEHLEWDLEPSGDWSLYGSAPEEVFYEQGDDKRLVRVRLRAQGGNFENAIAHLELTGGQGLVSTRGGDAMGAIEETIEVGSDSETLEIRQLQLYERAGRPTVRVLCHDPSFGDTVYYWDREIRRASRNISRRCDVDAEHVLERVEVDVEAELAFVDHQHGFDLILEPEQPGGPIGLALRTGDWGDEVPALFEGYEELLMPSLPAPELVIDADGRYLERADWSAVPIRHRDVEMAHVVVRHATAHHFLFWLTGDDDMAGAASFAVADQYIELDPGPAESAHSYIDLESLVGEAQPGAYQIEISDPYRRGVGDSHRFLVSDIQLIAKRASHTDDEVDEIWAWTIDAASAEPVSNMALELVRENGRVLAQCATDNDGHCQLSGNWGDLENEPPFAVVAEGGNELAYVDWVDTKTEIVEGTVGGAKYSEEKPHRGAIRGERTLYRPGETMHFAGFVRDDGYRAQAGIPVGVEITDARGQRAYGSIYETDSVGAIEFSYDIPEMASTGTWDVELFAGDEDIASQRVSVEEFVPERIDVEVDLDEYYQYQDSVRGQLQARYFFGAPAANTEFEIECQFEPTTPFRDQWPQYEFGPFGDEIGFIATTTRGTLDSEGRAEFECDTGRINEQAPYEVTVVAAVFEAGSGSPTRSEATTTLFPGEAIVGLRSPDDRVDVDSGARVEGIVVGIDGRVLESLDTVDLQVGSIRYSSTRLYRGGRYRWERERHESIDDRQTVSVDGGRFSFRAASRGSTVGIYIRADHRDSVTELEIDSPRRFWGWGRRDLDPRPDDPAHLVIDGPDEIAVDEVAEFSFDAPAAGRALVALETARVDTWEWIDVEPGPNSWEVTLEYFDPNIYVSALYVPTGEDRPQGMDRAFGVERVDVSRQRWRADIDLDVPSEREPYETLEIDVASETASADAQVVVAAVDRGILSMAQHEFQDPLDQLFMIRALGVDTFDTVGWYADVSPERFGGGAAPAPRPGPEAIMPVRPTAMWSGLVPLEQGRATVEFEIPDFRGELEIVAVLVDRENLGQATARTTVVDPLSLQATAPRFATHGDEFEIPVSVTNTTERAIDVEVNANILPDAALYDDDPASLEIRSTPSAQVSLEPGQRQEVVFDIRVVGRAGAPRVQFQASGGGETSRHYATVPVYPDGPATTESAHHAVDTRQFDVARHLDGWQPTSESTELWVTSIPRAPAFEHLDYVLRYPYLRLGTNLYNTVARIRPSVYLDSLLKAADPQAQSDRRGAYWRVRWGLSGIERLQDRSGRFRYWTTGRSTVDPWGHAYVLDMLTAADEAGHDVPDWVMRSGLDWLDRRVQRRHDLHELDLGLWVLARNGRPNRRVARALLEALPDDPSGRDHERAVLATASLYRAGDETVEGDLRRLIAEPALGDRSDESRRDRYTPARHEGLILDVAIELFGTESELLEKLVEDVADRLVDAEVGELNLHELGWSITALGRWAEARAAQLPEARLIAAGNIVEPAMVGDDGSRSWQVHRASEYPELILEFDEIPDQPVSVFRRTEGVHETATPEYGNQRLNLRRRYRRADGSPVNLSNVNVGDLIYVELEATHDEPRTLYNLALTDRIPGGFEIENPRPEGQLQPDWFDASERWGVEHFDVRDDRLELFGSIPREYGPRPRTGRTVKFVYSIRATTAGTFTMPPAELVSLYQHDRWARIQGRMVRIHRR